MFDYTTPTSHLEAVNALLDSVGLTPVNTLSPAPGEYRADVKAAEKELARVSRELQKKGWHFNTECNYPLTPSISSVPAGQIQLPTNTLRVDDETKRLPVVQRGDRLYNLHTHSFIFDAPVRATIVLLLPFDELPEPARDYIVKKASLQFQRHHLGASEQNQWDEQDAVVSYADLRDWEARQGDYNLHRSAFQDSTKPA